MSALSLLPIDSVIADVVVDLRYASANNVAKRPLHTADRPQLALATARQLAVAAAWFRGHELRIVIWDAFRTAEVQAALRALVTDDRYVALDSNHCHGMAVDMTLARADGSYVDMGTDFDDFSTKAHLGCQDLTEEQYMNRALLRQGMEVADFRPWPYEWWHFDYVADSPA